MFSHGIAEHTEGSRAGLLASRLHRLSSRLLVSRLATFPLYTEAKIPSSFFKTVSGCTISHHAYGFSRKAVHVGGSGMETRSSGWGYHRPARAMLHPKRTKWLKLRILSGSKQFGDRLATSVTEERWRCR